MKQHILSYCAISMLLNFQPLQAQIEWQTFETGYTSSLRGLAPVSQNICWVSGSEGKVLLTLDGGHHWLDRSPMGFDGLQFRDIHAFNKDTVLILSAGLPAVICRTTDAGLHWKTVYQNIRHGVFFDAMDFWDPKEGIAFSDAPHNKLLIIKTLDGGQNWFELDSATLPPVLPHQGGFAASGTCLRTFGENSVIIGLGGAAASLLISDDRGQSWVTSKAPLDYGASTKGVFSLTFLNDKHGFCVGGDYKGDSASMAGMAQTFDGGKNWTVVKNPLVIHHYHSCICHLGDKIIITVSKTGTRASVDGGLNWIKVKGGFFAVAKAQMDDSIWSSGDKGRTGKLFFTNP